MIFLVNNLSENPNKILRLLNNLMDNKRDTFQNNFKNFPENSKLFGEEAEENTLNVGDKIDAVYMENKHMKNRKIWLSGKIKKIVSKF